MKLILARNQTERFVKFYADLRARSQEPFDYTGYTSLLFSFNTAGSEPIMVTNMSQGHSLTDYNGVYINGFVNSYELAATVAICCAALHVPYVNKELQSPPSLSKLTSYAKLAAAGVSIPMTFAGTKIALLGAFDTYPESLFPAVLKRADADRGIDNFMIKTLDEVRQQLTGHDDESIWLLQEFIPNDGYYVINFYDQKPAFSIYRTLEDRPDGNTKKAHMYKPHGGTNATLQDLSTLPADVMDIAQQAVQAVSRQIASVDCLRDTRTGAVYVLEVNSSPQLVTIETYKDVRQQAFIDNLLNDWS